VNFGITPFRNFGPI